MSISLNNLSNLTNPPADWNAYDWASSISRFEEENKTQKDEKVTEMIGKAKEMFRKKYGDEKFDLCLSAESSKLYIFLTKSSISPLLAPSTASALVTRALDSKRSN